MTPNYEEIKKSLTQVIEPLRGKDIVSLGMLKSLDFEKNQISINIEIPTPVYRYKSLIEEKILSILKQFSFDKISISFFANTIPGNRGIATRLPKVRNIIAVAAGKGGVGKSTVATNLALSLSIQGAKVGLLDADIYGPSIPTMLGIPDSLPQAKENNKIQPAVHYGIQVISIGFFVDRENAVVWRGPMIHKLLQQFIEDVEWQELDYLIVDLPPGTGDTQLSLTQLLPLTGAVIVTTPQEIALIDVEKAISMFQKVEVPILGVVENMSYHTCSSCGQVDEIFSRGGGKFLSEKLHVPILGEIPIEGKIRYGGDIGRPIVIGHPTSESAKIFNEVALGTAENIVKRTSNGPKRASGLIQIR